MEREAALKVLNKKIMSCRKCPGLNIPKETMAAPGYGDLNAELMVVGQSLHSYNPKTPDQQIPFVGPVESRDSGKILYKALEMAGYSFEKKNLFITNVVHCHPPGNRPSTDKERNNCAHFLGEELNLVQPKIILALGKDARDWFSLQAPSTGKLVQYLPLSFSYYKTDYIVAHHPSYVMRSGNKFIKTYCDQMVLALKQAQTRRKYARKSR